MHVDHSPRRSDDHDFIRDDLHVASGICLADTLDIHISLISGIVERLQEILGPPSPSSN